MVVQRFQGKVAFAQGGTYPPIGGGGGGGVLTSSTRISAVAMETLASVPVQLIAAPGAGNIVQIIGGTMQYHGGNEGYASGTILFIGPDSDDFLWQTGDNALTLINAASAIQRFDGGLMTISASANQAVLAFMVSDLGVVGPITSLTGAGGMGYAVSDIGQISSGGGNASYEVTAVDGDGAVTGLSLTAPGSGYQNASGVSTFAGSGEGAGLLVDIVVTTPGTGAVQIDLVYTLISAAAA